MILVNKLLNYKKPWKLPQIFLFTGNPIVKRNGAIVMGRGAALQVRDTYPKVQFIIGAKIVQMPDAHILWTQIQTNQFIGWFKVKYHWQSDANIELIKRSTEDLAEIAIHRPHYNFCMNMPGVGNGRLKYDDVIKVIEQLPDNVFVFHKENVT